MILAGSDESITQGDRMKQAAMLVIMLALATFLYAQQQTPATQNQPAGKPGSTSQGAQPATPAQGAVAAQPAQPQGKRPPQAKTQPEFDAYKAATANTSDPAALEKAADDFAAKFPDSELRPILYRTAMHSYQAANNADKMLEMGRKVLKFDPDDPEALVGAAQVLAERTRDTDQDKVPEALKYAEQAVSLTKEGTAVGTAARNERDRLVQLNRGAAPGAKPPASAQNPTPH